MYAVQTLFPPSDHPKLYRSHFHQLICHVGFLYRRHAVFDLNSELEEGEWKLDRHIETKLSNHQNPMQNIRDRKYHIEKRDEYTTTTTNTNKKAILAAIGDVNEMNEIISVEASQSESFAWLLYSLRDFAEGEWYEFDEEKGWTFKTGTEEPETRGGVHVFRAIDITAEQLVNRMDEMYKEIKENNPNAKSIQIIEDLDTSENNIEGNYERWTKNELQDEIRERNKKKTAGEGIKVTGNKAELIKRLTTDDEQTEQTARESEPEQPQQPSQNVFQQQQIDLIIQQQRNQQFIQQRQQYERQQYQYQYQLQQYQLQQYQQNQYTPQSPSVWPK
jgi:hypothetical protein